MTTTTNVWAITGLHLLLLFTVGQCIQADSTYRQADSKRMEIKREVNVSRDIYSPEVITQQNNLTCPTWMIRTNATDGTCKCGKTINTAVKCNSILQQAYVMDCYCMTYDDTQGAVFGKCFYRCAARHDKKRDPIYKPVPQDPHQLNEDQCGKLNRDGRLCGSCKEGYSPLVYSYDIHCKNCTENSYYNIIQFVAAAFGPLTLFYMFVVISQCNANSPKLYGFFTVVQAITAPANVRIVLSYSNLDPREYPMVGNAVRLLMALYGISNLDFFRVFYTQICLEITPLQTLALDYAIAFYPLFLISISCLLIKLYSRDVRVLVWLWKPFGYCITSIRKRWQVKTSMIEVIATFLLLSYIKILTVSTDLLFYTEVYNVNDTSVGTYLYYDASVKYFGKEHLPYAITAILVLLIFSLLPVILLFLYPTKWFQKLLNCTNLRSRVIDTFIDSFQGFYKDGTEPGTRDCRYFSALVFTLRFLYWIIYSLTLNSTFYALSTLLLLMFALLYIVFKPYKEKFGVYNSVEVSMMVVLGMIQASILCINMSFMKSQQLETFALWFAFILTCIPLFYIMGIVSVWILERTKCGQRCLLKLKGSKLQEKEVDIESHIQRDELPDRITNPENYTESKLLLPPGGTCGDYCSCQEATY